MTRVLVLSDLWPPFPGGAERLIFNVARDLYRRGFDVEVLTGYGPARQFDGPPLTVAAFGVEEDQPEGARDLIAYLGLHRPDVVVTHHYYANQFRNELAGCGIPIVQIVLNGRRHDGVALAVYISEWVRETLGDAQPQDLVITPPAFDDVVASEHGDAIGFIKPIPHKGVEFVYKIARRLRDRRFVILRGEWQDIEQIQELDNIEFLEPVVDIRDFWSRVRIVLMPSTSEDAGTVAQEAAMNGVPCISTDVGGLRETNGGGIRLPADDLRRWIRSITALDNPAQYAHVVERQRAYLDAVDHPARFAELAARIAAL